MEARGRPLGKLFQSGLGGGGIDAFATENISASGTITALTSGQQYRPIAGDAGAQTASTTPFGTGADWETGTHIILRGTSNTNTVTIPHNDAANGALLNGAAVLQKDYILELIYDSTAGRWIERGRNF